jgi:hypothetical protein
LGLSCFPDLCAFGCGKNSGISQALDELTRIIIVAVRKKEADKKKKGGESLINRKAVLVAGLTEAKMLG